MTLKFTSYTVRDTHMSLLTHFTISRSLLLLKLCVCVQCVASEMQLHAFFFHF